MDNSNFAPASPIDMPSKTNTVPVKFIGAVEDVWQLYSDHPSDYTVGRPIGYGASSTVYQAEYHAANHSIPCALKVLDLDSLPVNSLRLLQRETQLMSLSKHPNVLRVRGTWAVGHKLYIALRLMRSGSVADVMRYGWPGGVEEEVARCVLKQALEGLNYLHINGFIHRDIKAANLLIDDDGTVLLGDLGVAASLNDEDSVPFKSPVISSFDALSPRPVARSKPTLGKRKSFVGTPCWMAPEVISQKQYDSKADIWSLGITALELAQGRAPRSREPSHKVLLRTIQDDPPTLDRDGGQFKYSKAFKEVIASCLMKDPNQRPTAAELLQTPFFRGTKKKGYLVGALLQDLPPLVDRQERRRIASALTHLTMDSWDFSQTRMSSPSVSLPLQGIFPHDDGLFEMEEVAEPAKLIVEKNEDIRLGFSTMSVHSRIRETTGPIEMEDTPALTDDAVSTPSTSPPNSIAVPDTRPSRRTSVPFPEKSSPSFSHSTSPSNPPGLWRKLRGKGSRILDKDKWQSDSSKSRKGELAVVSDTGGTFLQRIQSRPGSAIISRPFR